MREPTDQQTVNQPASLSAHLDYYHPAAHNQIVCDFGNEERATNNQKQNTVTSSARSGGEFKLQTE